MLPAWVSSIRGLAPWPHRACPMDRQSTAVRLEAAPASTTAMRRVFSVMAGSGRRCNICRPQPRRDPHAHAPPHRPAAARRRSRALRARSGTHPAQVPETVIPRAAGPIVVDGDPGDAAWRQAPPLEFVFPWDDVSGGGAQSTVARMLYDDDALYLLYECVDPYLDAEVTEHDGPVYEEDAVEIFVTPNPARRERLLRVRDEHPGGVAGLPRPSAAASTAPRASTSSGRPRACSWAPRTRAP